MWAVGAAFAVFAAASVALTAVDLREHRLPNRWLAWSFGLVATLLLLAAATTGEWPRFGRSILAAAGYAAAMLLMWRASRGGLGAGDVKLAPMIGLVAGWASPGAAMLWVPIAIAVIGLVAALVSARRNRAEFAFGPSMLLGCWAGLGLGALLG